MSGYKYDHSCGKTYLRIFYVTLGCFLLASSSFGREKSFDLALGERYRI